MRRRGCPSGQCCTQNVITSCQVCKPYYIPETTLTASWSGGGHFTGGGGGDYVSSGSISLPYSGNPITGWNSSATTCVLFINYTGGTKAYIDISVTCTVGSNIFQFLINQYNAIGCTGYTGGYSNTNGYILSNYICNPFSITLTANHGSYAGLPNFTLTGANPSQCGNYCGQIAGLVKDCCTLSGIGGVNVYITDHSTGNPIVNGPTDITGHYSFPVPSAADNYNISVVGPQSCSGFTSLSNISVPNNGTVTVSDICGYCYGNDSAKNACVDFNVYGCNSLLVSGTADALISVTDPFTNVTTGTTLNGDFGWCTNTSGNYTYTAISGSTRFLQGSGSFTISAPLCSGSGQTKSTTLAPKTTGSPSYRCFTVASSPGPCLYPLLSVLQCTFANAGLRTFTFSGSNWTASFTYLSVAYVINISASGTMTATGGGVGFTTTFTLVGCPVTGPFSGTITVPGGGLGSALGNGTITE